MNDDRTGEREAVLVAVARPAAAAASRSVVHLGGQRGIYGIRQGEVAKDQRRNIRRQGLLIVRVDRLIVPVRIDIFDRLRPARHAGAACEPFDGGFRTNVDLARLGGDGTTQVGLGQAVFERNGKRHAFGRVAHDRIRGHQDVAGGERGDVDGAAGGQDRVFTLIDVRIPRDVDRRVRICARIGVEADDRTHSVHDGFGPRPAQRGGDREIEGGGIDVGILDPRLGHERLFFADHRMHFDRVSGVDGRVVQGGARDRVGRGDGQREILVLRRDFEMRGGAGHDNGIGVGEDIAAVHLDDRVRVEEHRQVFDVDLVEFRLRAARNPVRDIEHGLHRFEIREWPSKRRKVGVGRGFHIDLVVLERRGRDMDHVTLQDRPGHGDTGDTDWKGVLGDVARRSRLVRQAVVQTRLDVDTPAGVHPVRRDDPAALLKRDLWRGQRHVTSRAAAGDGRDRLARRQGDGFGRDDLEIGTVRGGPGQYGVLRVDQDLAADTLGRKRLEVAERLDRIGGGELDEAAGAASQRGGRDDGALCQQRRPFGINVDRPGRRRAGGLAQDFRTAFKDDVTGRADPDCAARVPVLRAHGGRAGKGDAGLTVDVDRLASGDRTADVDLTAGAKPDALIRRQRPVHRDVAGAERHGAVDDLADALRVHRTPGPEQVVHDGLGWR